MSDCRVDSRGDVEDRYPYFSRRYCQTLRINRRFVQSCSVRADADQNWAYDYDLSLPDAKSSCCRSSRLALL